ncbi:MAG TPA: hypothetical protein DER02_07360 [Gammaproteobacteria bacterium]|nr:hypothetical protein [Gammaproteobacteria bacterium]
MVLDAGANYRIFDPVDSGCGAFLGPRLVAALFVCLDYGSYLGLKNLDACCAGAFYEGLFMCGFFISSPLKSVLT